ncbi:hypothetical protein FHG87_007966 [Trinorchestia longiramus]|nr:hypothetical protein FHG87_007966 [Trinorchestia longiramus]
MEVIYTEIELKDKKYADLLKIAQTLGIKGGRQKTNKLISSILEHQDGQQLCLNISDSCSDPSLSSSTAVVSPLSAKQNLHNQTNGGSSENSILDVDEMLSSKGQQNQQENDLFDQLDFKTSLADGSTEVSLTPEYKEAASVESLRQSRSKIKAPAALLSQSHSRQKRRRSASSEPVYESPKCKIRKTRASISHGPALTTTGRRTRRRASVAPSSGCQVTHRAGRSEKKTVPDLKEDVEGVSERSDSSAMDASSADLKNSSLLHEIVSPGKIMNSNAECDYPSAENSVLSPRRVSSTSKKDEKASKKGKLVNKKHSSSKYSSNKRLSSTPAKVVLNTSKSPTSLNGVFTRTSPATPRNVTPSRKRTTRIAANVSAASKKSTSASPKVIKLTSPKFIPNSPKKSPCKEPTPKLVKATRSSVRNSPNHCNSSVLDGSTSISFVKRDASFTVEPSRSVAEQNASSCSASQDSVSSLVTEISKGVTPLCLPGISSAQSKRLSEARRLSSPRIQRVEPTYAKPVFTIGRKDDSNTETTSKGTAGATKSSIPRFMAYAQKIKKIPNFKRIHEKAFDTMQNIDEFIAKKKKLGESVTKAKRASSGFVPSVTTPTKLKLNFSATPRGANSPVVRFGASPPASTSPASQAPAASITSEKKRVTSRRMSSVKENVKPATPRASMSTPFGAGPGLRRASTALPTPRSAFKTCNPASSVATHTSSTITKSHGHKSRLVDAGQSADCVSANVGMSGTARARNSESIRTSAVASSVKRSVSICKPVFSSSKLGGAGSHAYDSSARKSTISRASRAAASATGYTKLSMMSKLPRYQFPDSVPVSENIRKIAGRKPPVVSQADRRAKTQDFIKGVRTNKRFRLQMERRGINI